MRYIAYLLLTFWVVACSQPKKSHSENSLSSDTIRYAQGFTVHHFDGYTAVEVRDPWDSTRLLQRYLLVDRDRPVPGNLPKGTVVQVPAQNVVVYTSVHAAIIDQLGETNIPGGDESRCFGYRTESRTDCRYGRGDRP